MAVDMGMLTGHPLERKLKDLREHGMTDWLLKPPRLEQLAPVVAEGLGE